MLKEKKNLMDTDNSGVIEGVGGWVGGERGHREGGINGDMKIK